MCPNAFKWLQILFVGPREGISFLLLRKKKSSLHKQVADKFSLQFLTGLTILFTHPALLQSGEETGATSNEEF